MSVGIPNEGILKACQGEHLKEVLGHHPPRVSQGNHLYKAASFSFPKMSMFSILIINNTSNIISITLVAKKSSAIVSRTEDCVLTSISCKSCNYLDLLVSTWYVPMCWLWPQHRLLHLKDCGILYTLLIRQIWALDLRTSSVAVIAMIWYDNLLNLKIILTHPPCQWWEYASYESKNHLRSELTPLLFLRDKQTTMPMAASHFCL